MKRLIVLALIMGAVGFCAAGTAATSPLTGVYQVSIRSTIPQLNGTWLMSFAGNGGYAIVKQPGTKTLLIGGVSSVSGKILTMRDTSGPLRCTGLQVRGTYSWSLAGKTLRLKITKDTCVGRATVLASSSWTKVR